MKHTKEKAKVGSYPSEFRTTTPLERIRRQLEATAAGDLYMAVETFTSGDSLIFVLSRSYPTGRGRRVLRAEGTLRQAPDGTTMVSYTVHRNIVWEVMLFALVAAALALIVMPLLSLRSFSLGTASGILIPVALLIVSFIGTLVWFQTQNAHFRRYIDSLLR